MKRFLFLIIIIGIGSKAFGQIEFKPQFKAIKPKTSTVKPKKENDIPPPSNLAKFDIPKIITPNVFKETNIHNSKPKVNNSFQMGLKSGFSMTPTNKFVNPGYKVLDKLNKKADNEDQIVYRRNQNLGEFRTKSPTAKVTYRDYGEVDGDQIRVLLNEKAIATGIYLDSNFKGFEITLVDGFNKIDFEALNQGRLGPNTAEFQVYDDKGNLISASQWNLGTGFKATIIITKE